MHNENNKVLLEEYLGVSLDSNADWLRAAEAVGVDESVLRGRDLDLAWLIAIAKRESAK